MAEPLPDSVMTRRAPHDGRPTLKTIADATGLAVATVSRALKDAPDIGDATKLRVRAMAKELGYRPNRAGVRLRTGKTNVIALVLSTDANVMNHTARLIYALSASLRGTSYHMIVTPYSAADDPMEPIRYIVETGSADGVILNQTCPDDPRVRYLTERGLPFATHGRTEMGIAHPFFDFDNAAFARLCVDQLAARGRRRLALLAPPEGQSYGEHMRRGFFEACEAHGIEGKILPGVDSDAPMAAAEKAVAAVLAAPGAPDGIISGSTSAAMAIVAAAEASGRTIGQEIDVAAKEAVPFLRHFRRDMIVIGEDVHAAGSFLARAVMAAIEDREAPPLQHLDQPTLEARPGPSAGAAGEPAAGAA